ncbi:MAG: hypothetical protein AB8B99_04090 [Phormidesmis sp.]
MKICTSENSSYLNALTARGIEAHRHLSAQPSPYRATPAFMNEAADRLTQYFYLLAKNTAISGGGAAVIAENGVFESDASENGVFENDASENDVIKVLMQQAEQSLAASPEFQQLLAASVPAPLQPKAQKWLMRRLYTCQNSCQNAEQLARWVKQQLEKIVVSIQKDEALRELIQQIQGLPHGSRDRRNLIQTLLIEIQTAESRLKHLSNLSPELFNDALHETLLWFCEHLDDYDPTRSGPVTWFNRNLFYQGMKLLRARNRPLPARFTNTEKSKLHQGGPDAYDTLIVEAEYQILDDLYDWIHQDKTGQLKRTSLTDRLDINVQTVTKAVLDRIRVLRSLSQSAARSHFISADIEPYDIFSDQPTSLSQLFDYLSAQLEYPPDKLRRFWRERCRPHIQAFLQQSGNG